MSRATSTRATLRLALGATLISFAPVFVRLVDVAPTASAFYRIALGAVILLVLARLRGHRIACGRPALLALIGAGVMFAGDLGVWHHSIWYIGPGLATLLGNFQVFILALAGILLFGERLRWELAVAIPTAVAGLALIVGLDWSVLDPGYRLGLILGLATAVLYAAYILFLRRARVAEPASSPLRDLALASLVAAPLLLLGGLAEGTDFTVPTFTDAGLLVAYAVVAQVLGWVVISGSLPHVPASRVGLILLLQPFLAFVWDVLFFARPLTGLEALGGGLVLAAVYLGTRPPRHAAQS